MKCNDLRQMIDSYLDDELLVETNHDVHRHLENCRDCREYLASCRELRERLKLAVKSDVDIRISPQFSRRLRKELSTAQQTTGIFSYLFGPGRAGLTVFAAAVAAILLAFGLLFLRTSSGTPAPSVSVQNTNADLADAIHVAWREIADLAVGDHKNCAVKFNLSEKPISLDEAAKRYGAANKDIDKTIFENLKTNFATSNDKIEFLEAHSCLYAGRRFAHIVLKRNGKIVSILVTDTDLPAGTNDTIDAGSGGQLTAAGRSVGHHAYFVVSEMGASDNVAMANSLLPAIRRHIEAAGA